jgi:hypothetical protein
MTVENIFEKLTKDISRSGIVAYFIHEKYSKEKKIIIFVLNKFFFIFHFFFNIFY